MKKRLLRLSKRILILSLCTCLVSGSVIQKYKITANATAIAATLSAYGAYEICLWLGYTLAASCGIGLAIENRDELAELGKNLVDSCSFDEASDWVIAKASAAGQQQVYGREVFDYIRAMTLAAVLAGGSSPENNNNDDDDDDEPEANPEETPSEPTAEELYQARTDELATMAIIPVGGFLAVLGTAFSDIREKLGSGESNVITESLSAFDPQNAMNSYGSFASPDENGVYQYFYDWEEVNYGIWNDRKHCFWSFESTSRVVGYVDSSNYLNVVQYNPDYDSLSSVGYMTSYKTFLYKLNSDTVESSGASNGNGVFPFSSDYRFNANFPIFQDKASALNYLQIGLWSGCLNYAKTYQIADWLQEDWTSTAEKVNTGIRSLGDNANIVGEASNQALQNQLDGKGYIEALDGAIAATEPLTFPSTMADPVYFPEDSSVPKLDPSTFPWFNPATAPDIDIPLPDSDGNLSEDDIRGRDPFGINTLFGILVLLIMILLMLLIIFLSCLAFIIMIFRIEPTTGFLPPEMVQGFEYLKTLEIPGFGMSVYEFFMALIYIILIFTVVGILRKNIDKIRFPRKGRLK